MRDGRVGNIRLFSPISEKAAESRLSSIGFGENCCSPPERVGRDGFLDLAFRRNGLRTILSHRRFTHPLQALAPIRTADGSLCLMMLNPSGGLVGGDRLRTSVEVGPGAAVVLTTASATKVYRTEGEAASHRTLITLRDGAALEYLPDHVIPHTGSVLRQSLSVEMAPGSRAIVYDAIAAGRIGRGERWDFREMASEIAIRRDDRPVYISRSRIIPRVQPLTQPGWMEAFNYLATVVVVADSITAWSRVLDEIDVTLRQHPAVYSGVSEISAGGWVVRLMTRTAADLIIAKGKIWAIARRAVLGLDAFDLRK